MQILDKVMNASKVKLKLSKTKSMMSKCPQRGKEIEDVIAGR